MNATLERSTLGRLLDPIRDCLTPEVAARTAALRADAATQAKLDDFAEKNGEGTLTPDEQDEYGALVSALNLIAILQAHARSVLAADKPFVVEMSGTEPVASPRRGVRE
ncbi:MAG: hypothetical protein K2X82_32520 [Gemmataceae bacterium]|nr:hypothetical protein [Gemmataceae bacterium]